MKLDTESPRYGGSDMCALRRALSCCQSCLSGAAQVLVDGSSSGGHVIFRGVFKGQWRGTEACSVLVV